MIELGGTRPAPYFVLGMPCRVLFRDRTSYRTSRPDQETAEASFVRKLTRPLRLSLVLLSSSVAFGLGLLTAGSSSRPVLSSVTGAATREVGSA